MAEDKLILEPTYINATTIPDAFHQALFNLLHPSCQPKTHKYLIDKGSYEGHFRHEFDNFCCTIAQPWVRPLLPTFSKNLGIPNPVDEDYLMGYTKEDGTWVKGYTERYLLSDEVEPTETYTYGQRMNGEWILSFFDIPKESTIEMKVEDSGTWYKVSQVQEIVRLFRDKKAFGTNQAVIEIGKPEDILSSDPPCLRLIQFRVIAGHLHMIVYFRSWDLWNGFPCNIAGLQIFKEYMCAETGLEDGSITAYSPGLHLYKYAVELAALVTHYNLGPDGWVVTEEGKHSTEIGGM